MTGEKNSQHNPAQATYTSAAQALEANLHLLDRAKRVFMKRMSLDDCDDAYQDAAVAFLENFDKFDPARGVPFEGFMWPHVLGAFMHRWRSLALHAERVLAVEDITDFDRPVPDSAHDHIVSSETTAYVRSLPRRDREIVFRLYWLDEAPTSIAATLGITRQSIHIRVGRLLADARSHLTAA